MLVTIISIVGCSAQKNTARSRWWQSFTARYNTYYNGGVAFVEGAEEQEKGNEDNFTEMLPLYIVGNKDTRNIGRGNFDRAIEKSEKAIRLHSIKRRPEWTKQRRKTAKDIEWLSRREYNPFLWRAWLLLGKSQFWSGQFEEAAATFSYMSRLYATQPAIYGQSRAWLAKSYCELGWTYDAEDVLRNMQRDSIHYKAQADFDYALCDYYLHMGQYSEAAAYLAKVIKHEKRRKQKAREWFLMGQLQRELGNQTAAYKAFAHVIRLNPPYQTEFNARIAQTEVMAQGNWKQMISKLRRMASNDNNNDYLEQVYYAIGNIYLARHDTANAVAAYEKGNELATRSGIEKGVLLLKLGNIYWEKEKYSDSQRCYGEAIGLLDKERDDYAQLSERSKILDELVPHTEAVHLQDSLQALAKMPETERLAAIDRVIEALNKKEREERLAREAAEAEMQQAQQAQMGNLQGSGQTSAPTAAGQSSGEWYFYNPIAVSQGKSQFQQLWGKRPNEDNWQRSNKTVLASSFSTDGESDEQQEEETDDGDAVTSGKEGHDTAVADSTATTEAQKAENDPHTREYYLAQIPFTEEQLEASNAIIQDGLFNSGVMFKDKLDNLERGEQSLTRLTTQFPGYEKNDEAWYHLFLIYSRCGNAVMADRCKAMLNSTYPESRWTQTVCDPYFADNARFGTHIEDSLYAATYDAFKADRHNEITANAAVSRTRYPQGENRAKFLFIEGLSMLNNGDADGCTANLKEVVENFPQSEVAEMAGMILKGVQEGRRLHGGKFDIGDVWSRRSVTLASDSIQADTLSADVNTNHVFILAYDTDSIDQNKLLYEMARYNFTNFLVRNFNIEIDSDNGINRMIISGFLSYDEALQYARRLYSPAGIGDRLQGCRRIIISTDNLKLLGTKYSYKEYEEFFEKAFAPLPGSDLPLLAEPESMEQADRPLGAGYPEYSGENPVADTPENNSEDPAPGKAADEPDDDDTDDTDDAPQNITIDFDDDFYR